MPPEIWQRVKSVVYNALQLKPEEWPHYLQESCDGDTEVLKEARSLLEVSWSIGNFIEVPVTEYLQHELPGQRAKTVRQRVSASSTRALRLLNG